MKFRLTILPITLLLAGLVACSSTGTNPVLPDHDSATPVTGINTASSVSESGTYLWGYYDVLIDPESREYTLDEKRNVLFTSNIVTFLNASPASITFDFNDVMTYPDCVDIDLNVTIKHPFPGLPKFNGYDVRGIFMGNGSGTLETINGVYSQYMSDQMMIGDPSDSDGAPDGYTRWFNVTEFSESGMPMFDYTEGVYATHGYHGNATICPYKYFADGLGPDENLWEWLTENPESNGVFSSGVSNTRRYKLSFPLPGPGVRFSYAVTANWEDHHSEPVPSNAHEAVACSVVDNSTVFFNSQTEKGGNLKLDISLFNWYGQPSNIYIESTVLSAPYELDPTINFPISGTDTTSTWSVDIPADNISGDLGNEYWIIAEYSAHDYKTMGTLNLADDPLMAFFRFDLQMNTGTSLHDPVCDIVIDPSSPSMPFSGWGAFTFDATGAYDPDGTDLSYEWDFDNDGIYGDYYNFGPPSKPTKVFEFENHEKVWVRITDENGGEAVCSVDVDITGVPSKNIPLRSGVVPTDLAVDPADGDLLILYDDWQVWRYPISAYYAAGNHLVSTWSELTHIDIAANSWFLVAGFRPSMQRPMGVFYDGDGASPQYWNFEYGPSGFVSDEYRFLDVIAWGDSGSHENDIGPMTGAPYPNPGDHSIRFMNMNDSNNYHLWTRYTHTHTGTDHSGTDKIFYDYVTGVESDPDGNHLWIAEDTEFMVTRWLADPPLTYEGNGSWAYDNVSFGTGIQSDDDDAWNESRDLTRDNDSHYYILDMLSTGDPRVKVWDFDGTSTSSLGGFGDTVTIQGEPRRLEGSDFNGNILVLHGDPTGGYFISVFVDGEMPS